MGSTTYRSDFTKDQIFKAELPTTEILKISKKGNSWWFLYRTHDNEVDIGIALWRRDDGCWNVKLMSAEEGPYYYDVPVKFFGEKTKWGQFATEWRERVIKLIDDKKKCVEVGKTYHYPGMVSNMSFNHEVRVTTIYPNRKYAVVAEVVKKDEADTYTTIKVGKVFKFTKSQIGEMVS